MAILLSDTFTRANNTTVVGAPEIGPTPTVPLGVAGINTNQLSVTTNPAQVVWELGTPDVEFTAVNPNTLASTTGLGIMLGWVNTNNFWYVYFDTDETTLYQVIGGNLAQTYATTVAAASTGATVKASHSDGMIRVHIAGVEVFRWRPEVPLTGTGAGIRFPHTSKFVGSVEASDAPAFPTPDLPGALSDQQFAGVDAGLPDGFVYLGRDTKIQDAAAGV